MKSFTHQSSSKQQHSKQVGQAQLGAPSAASSNPESCRPARQVLENGFAEGPFSGACSIPFPAGVHWGVHMHHAVARGCLQNERAQTAARQQRCGRWCQATAAAAGHRCLHGQGNSECSSAQHPPAARSAGC